MKFLESRIVAVYDTLVIESGDDDFSFRIEIHKKCGSELYFPKVFRLEHYRIQPTFPKKDGGPAHDTADEEIFVYDFFFDSDRLSGASEIECLEKVEQKLIETFRSPGSSETSTEAPAD